MADWLLAQANASSPRFALTDPRMLGFLEGVARVNALAESAPGFVWRHTSPGGHLEVGEPSAPLLLNMSLWTDYESLHTFTYAGLHGRFLSDRARWFSPLEGATAVMWWVDRDERPTPQDALARLRHLRTYGSGPRAFSVLRRYEPTGAPVRRPAP